MKSHAIGQIGSVTTGDVNSIYFHMWHLPLPVYTRHKAGGSYIWVTIPFTYVDVVFMGVYYAYIKYVRRGQSSPGSLAGFDPVNIYFCFICILFILLV